MKKINLKMKNPIKEWKNWNKKKKTISVIISVVLVCVLVVTLILSNRKGDRIMPQTSASETKVVLGNISNTIVGTGNLEIDDSNYIKIPDGITIEKVNVESGDAVSKGDVLATVDKASVLEVMEAIEDELNELDEKINEGADEEETVTVRATVSGKVKKVYAKKGSTVSDLLSKKGALIVIAVDGSDNLVEVVAVDGTISEVSVSKNETVSKGDKLMVIKTEGESTAYKKIIEERKKLSALYTKLSLIAKNGTILADMDGVIGTVNVSADSSINSSNGNVIDASKMSISINNSSKVTKQENSSKSAVVLTTCKKSVDITGANLTTQALTTSTNTRTAFACSDGEFVNIDNSDDTNNNSTSKNETQGDTNSNNENNSNSGNVTKGDSNTDNDNNDSDSGNYNQGNSNTSNENNESNSNKKYLGDSNAGNKNKDSNEDNGNSSIISNNIGDSKTTGSSENSNTDNDSLNNVISLNTNTSDDSESSTDTNESSITEIIAFTIASNDNMILSVNVDELDINSVEVNQDATITLDAIEDKTYTGKVTRVSNTATSAGSGVAKYTVEITISKDEQMKSGMNASATIVIENKENVLTLPVTAIQEKGNQSFVYTSKDSEGNLSGEVVVTTGLSDGDNVEIMEGLLEGDTVYYLKTGNMSGGGMDSMFGGEKNHDGNGKMEEIGGRENFGDMPEMPQGMSGGN